MKKIIATVLASACAVSALAISASAASKAVTAAGEVKLTANAGVATPAIDVSVPSTIAAVINPYGVPVTVNKVTYGAEGLTSPLYTIVNRTSSSNIKVSVTASVVVPTTTVDAQNTVQSIKVVGSKDGVKTDDTNKYLYAYVVGSKAAEITLDDTAETGNCTISATGVLNYTGTYTDKLKAATEEGKLMEDDTDNVSNKVVFTDVTPIKTASATAVPANTANPQTLVVLRKATHVVPTATTWAKGDKISYCQFQIGGKVNGNVVWGAADKITVNMALNLAPTAENYSGQS